MRIPGNRSWQEMFQKRQAETSESPALHTAHGAPKSMTSEKPKPTAPPPFKPQANSPVLQQKAAALISRTKQIPKAPPAYKPLPVPKVLQTKSRVTANLTTQLRQPPTAPPVYRPQQLKVPQATQSVPLPDRQPIQRKEIPVFRPPKSPRILQPKTPLSSGRTGKGVIQRAKHIYQGTKGTIDEIEVNTNKVPNKITLNGKTDPKVQGTLNYRRYDDGTISIRTISTFPHGYGLGAILLYHLGEKALKRNCRAIVVGGPAGTELGFYFRLGATTTKTGATDPTTFNFLHDRDERESAWRTISIDSAEKEWDSSYFLGGTGQKYGGLDEGLKEALIRSKRESGDRSVNDSIIDTYLKNFAAYKTSPDGVIFKDIRGMMNKCLESINKNWEKITRYPGREYLSALLDL